VSRANRFGLLFGVFTFIVGVCGMALMQMAPPEGPMPPPESPSTAVVDAGGPPAPSEDAGPPEAPQRVLGQFTTRFKAGPKYVGRGTNIRLLADKLHRTVLKPGQEFSFNKGVGPRTEKEGYQPAPTYFLGEVIPGIGGGSCQVSSTLYAALVHANVEILDRRPHSRASSYIKPGLDATVNYPPECWDAKKPDKRICFDLVFRNPYDFPLTIEFDIGDDIKDGKRTLSALVLGTGESPKVTTAWRPSSTTPFKTRYRRVSWWKDSRKKLSQSGRLGVQGYRILTIEHADGRRETKRVLSRYQPVPEVYKVGMEFEKPEEPDAGATSPPPDAG